MKGVRNIKHHLAMKSTAGNTGLKSIDRGLKILENLNIGSLICVLSFFKVEGYDT